MKNWITTQFDKIPTYSRWIVLMFVQIWLWPQILDPRMPAGIGFSAIVTMAICVVYNFIKIVNAYEDRDR